LSAGFAGGGSLLAAYTNAKLISNADTLTNWLEPAPVKSRMLPTSGGNAPCLHRTLLSGLVISYVVDLPFGHGKTYLSGASGYLDKLVGGWELTV